MKRYLILTNIFFFSVSFPASCGGSVLDHLRAECVSRKHCRQPVRGGGCSGNASGCGALPHQGGSPKCAEPHVGPEFPVPHSDGGLSLPALHCGGAQQLTGHRPKDPAHQSSQARWDPTLRQETSINQSVNQFINTGENRYTNRIPQSEQRRRTSAKHFSLDRWGH